MLGLSSAVSISVYDSRNSTIKETTTATFSYNKACVLTDLAVSSITTSSGSVLSDQTYRVQLDGVKSVIYKITTEPTCAGYEPSGTSVSAKLVTASG